ncbi:putative RNA-polymerase subunit [uncultured phage cr128_1]|uniref:Putative RNA-polymerase subunit n=1 Tax=uncultured phage cr128_1 TaxID=2772076 RepID=A0A7M1S2Q7_9CAUD|nr:putative RNA-polymerase subunit [uncultured phage cr128_1]QOR59700.1 putative RNA-polymerase subunit [uncultured phage cr128_1]
MSRNCAIIPQVRNNKDQIVDSRLFKDLLAYTGNNRAETTRLYLITKSSEFIKDWNPRLTLDENNEPTLRSLLQKTNFSDIIPESKVLERLNREIGYYKRGMDRPALWVNNDENYQKLLQKVISFNQTSDFRDDYVAKIIKIQDTESPRIFIGVKVEKRNRLNSIDADKMAYNANLNSRLRDILAANGIAVGALTDLEKRMGINGVTDFDVARTAANGMIEMIRLANGIEGEKALPEEFAHFAIEAMGESPLINRLINNLSSSGLIGEILGDEYETYNTLYKGDTAKLAKEAAGKLLAKHLLKSEPIGQKPYKNLLERVISAIKSFFKTINVNQIQKAIYEADKDFGRLARDILNGRMDEEISIDNIKSSDLFYQTNERIQRDRKVLQNIINNELKRLKIYEKRNPNSQFSTNQRLLIDRLEMELYDNNEIEGIYSFLDNALEELQKVSYRLELLRDTPATNVNERASVLRDVRNYMYSYKNIIEDIRKALVDEERYDDNRYGQRVRVLLNDTSNLLGDLFVKYNSVSMPLFVDFIKPFVGENIMIPFGKFKGKVIKAEDLVKMADKDISFFDRWLDSMADSSDYMLKVMDQAVKKSKEQARSRTIDVMKQLQAATIKLEKAGIKNTDWMFERDSKGNLSGNYISEINQALFKEKVREMFKSLNEKYGKNPVGENAEKYKKERQAWFDANMEIVNGKKVPKMSIYGNKQYQRLNAAQKEYYDTVMNIKSQLDSYLPEKYTTLTNAVKIRKDLLERVKSSDGVRSGAKQIWKSIKDEFIRRTDDVDFGDRATVKDFEGNEVQTLPIYFTKLKEGESANDLSTDIVSTLTAYAAMANDFDEMNKVIDVLELGRDLLRERQVIQTQGGKPLVEKFKAVGRKVESKLTKEGEATRFVQRLNDFFEMQVYGRYMADEGTFGKTNIDKGKVANFVNRVTSMNNLALNVLSGISNIATGKVMMRIESFAGEFFNEKNTITADRIYGQSLPAYLAEIGNRVKTSKLALWDELFNVMQEYEQDVREVNFDRKTWFSRMFGTSTLFFMNNAGEHWMQNRTSLALADAYKMKAPNGKIVSLWDAMEVVPIDKNNKKLGAKLQLKQGYKKADGSDFTQDDIIKFSRRSAAINQRMHGIYNKADRSAVQRLAIGRMGMMFRKWIKPSLNRRFKSASYNYDLDAWTEGYYRTSGRFLLQLARDLRETQFNIAARWNELTSTEKANIKRALTETGHFLAVMAIIGLIEWSDDKDRPWLVRMTEYQMRRLYTELGAMIPGKSMISEGLKIIKSPAAGVNTIENILDLTKLLNPWNYTDEIQSGRYEGHSTTYKSFFESPVIPMNRTIYRGLHPETGIPFFKQ